MVTPPWDTHSSDNPNVLGTLEEWPNASHGPDLNLNLGQVFPPSSVIINGYHKLKYQGNLTKLYRVRRWWWWLGGGGEGGSQCLTSIPSKGTNKYFNLHLDVCQNLII